MSTDVNVKDANNQSAVIQTPVQGTAGSPSIDVSSVQGVPGGVAVGVSFQGVTVVDRSGTIAVGGTAQTLAAANTSRRGLLFQNQSASPLWLNTKGGTASATQTSLSIPAYGYWESPVSGIGTSAVSVFGATTSQAFTCEEW